MRPSRIAPLVCVVVWVAMLAIAGTMELRPMSALPAAVKAIPAPSPSPSACLGTVEGEQRALDCRDPAAAYVVLGTVDRIPRGSDPHVVCAPWPRATSAIWKEYTLVELMHPAIGVASSGLGKVTCVVEVKR